VKPSLVAAAGMLVLGACHSPNDWRTYKASRAAFGEAPGFSLAQDEPVLTEDQRFVQEVACGVLFEVDCSRLALSRNVSEPVRAFAQMMLEDHARASLELRDLLQRKAIDVPPLEGSPRADELARLGDEEFERAYLDAQLAAHEEAIRDFEEFAEADEDEDRRAFVQRLLPVLRVHWRELDHMLRGR
jgi:putative membrane protein